MQHTTSIQHRLDRVRPPRVHITYDAEVGGAIELVELPFVLGVLSDLLGTREASFPHLRERQFIEIDLDNFNVVMAEIQPRLAFTVENMLPGGDSQLAVDLCFHCMDDFEPAQVISQIPPLLSTLEIRQLLTDDHAQGDSPHWGIPDLDRMLSQQLNRVLHAPEFQKLEAAWRGLYFLVLQTETSPLLKIRVLNVSKEELSRDLERSSTFDLSTIFKKVYEDVYGTFGGKPFGALIGDYEFGPSPQELGLLEKIAHVAAMAHAPFIAAASPRLFNLHSFNQLGEPRDLAKIFDGIEYGKWRSFRELEDARYVGLTVPRMLLRTPYVPRPPSDISFQFTEEVDEDHRFCLWGNAAYAFGACLTNAFAKYGWCATITGIEGGGLIERLPIWTVTTDEGEVAPKCPTEIAISDRREKELADLGFLPLVHCKGTEYAAFFSVCSCQRPHRYDSDIANLNARLATLLQYTLTTSRFAHYLKVMMRDKIGSFMSRGECEHFLNRWLSHYTTVSDDVSLAAKAQFPLREARVDVSEAKGKPGIFQAVMFLRPHFQLDELSVSLRLVVELPALWH